MSANVAAGRLEHVGVASTPQLLEKNVQLYLQSFGWHMISGAPGKGGFAGDGAGGRIEFFAVEGLVPLADPHHLAFAVNPSDFSTTVDALREAGAHVEEPWTNALGDQVAYFNDLAGNRAQVIARKEPLAP